LACTPGGKFFLNIFSVAVWIFSAFFVGSSDGTGARCGLALAAGYGVDLKS
jgi:hypothetical protein